MSGAHAATHVGSTQAHEPLAGVWPNLPTGAACVGHDPELWFDHDNDEARRICHTCPIQQACGTWGWEHREWGVWAGIGSGHQRLGTKMQYRYHGSAA